MLEIKDLHVSYGGIQALRGVSLTVPEGRIVTLIGANGAGKSTLMRTISGLVKAQSGSILWNGQEAVSYTHLDVYKRQPEILSALFLSGAKPYSAGFI